MNFLGTDSDSDASGPSNKRKSKKTKTKKAPPAKKAKLGAESDSDDEKDSKMQHLTEKERELEIFRHIEQQELMKTRFFLYNSFMFIYDLFAESKFNRNYLVPMVQMMKNLKNQRKNKLKKKVVKNLPALPKMKPRKIIQKNLKLIWIRNFIDHQMWPRKSRKNKLLQNWYAVVRKNDYKKKKEKKLWMLTKFLVQVQIQMKVRLVIQVEVNLIVMMIVVEVVQTLLKVNQ